MTKRTVAKTRATSKPRTEKPVDSDIRRAAKRAGIRQPEGLSFEDAMKLNQGEQYEKLLRQVGHTDDQRIAEQLRKAASELSDRAIAGDLQIAPRAPEPP